MAPTGPRTVKTLLSKASAYNGPLNLAAISTLTTIASMHGVALSIITAISLTFPADVLIAYLSVCPSESFKAVPFLMLFLPWLLAYMDATPQGREQLLAADDWPLAEGYKTYLSDLAAGTLKSPSRRTAAAAARAASPPPRNNTSSAHDSGDDDRDPAAVERSRSQLAGETFIADVRCRLIPLATFFLLVLGSPATDPVRAIFFTEIAPMVALLAAAMEAPGLIAYLDTPALRAFTDAATDFVAGFRRSVLKPLAAGSPPADPARQVLIAGAQDRLITSEGQDLLTQVICLADGAGGSVMLNALHHKLRTTTSASPADITPAAAAAARIPAPAAAVVPPAPAPMPSVMDQLRTAFGGSAIDYLASAEIAGLPLQPPDRDDEPPSALHTAGAAGGVDSALPAPLSIGAPLTATAQAPGPVSAPPPPTAVAAAALTLTSSARVMALRPHLPPTEEYMRGKVDRVGDNIPSRNQQQPGQEEQFSFTMSPQGGALLTARPRSTSNQPISPAEFVAGSHYILYNIYLARIADPKMFEALVACYGVYEQHIIDLFLRFPSLEMYRPIQNYDLAVRNEICKGAACWDDAVFGNLFNLHISTSAVLAYIPRGPGSFAPNRGDFRPPRLAAGPPAAAAAYCRNYNRPASGGCTLANCPRPHVCSSCGGGHPNCSASGSGGQSGGRGGFGGRGTRGSAV